MRKIKILFVLPNLMAGGAERVTLNIIRQLESSQFEIYLLLINDYGEYKNLIPPNVKILNLNKSKTIYSVMSFIKVISKIKPEIIFSSLNRTSILTLFSKLFYSKSLIIIREPNMPSKELNNLPLLTKLLTKKLYKYASIVIAQTDEMREEILNSFHSLDKNNVLTINNPIDKEYINSSINNNLSPYKKIKNLKNILAIGSLTKRKGFDILLNAFKLVLEKKPNINLYILGKGEEKKELLNLAKKLGIENKIKFEGFQSNPYIYLKHADLFVLSSRYEGLPNVVLEALYIKTPVVITNCVPFISNIVVNSKMGYVVEVENIEDMAEKIEKSLEKDYSQIEQYEQFNFDFNNFFFNLYKRNLKI